LTIVTAPAGFGKTTLVCEWLRHSQRTTAWLSLDENDNDPARFLAYLTAALRTILPGIDRFSANTLEHPQRDKKSWITALVNHNRGSGAAAVVFSAR